MNLFPVMESRGITIAHSREANMTTRKNTIVGLGELLWDIFAQGKQLGGAPANFAYMTNLLGDEGVVASRVGKDRLGNAAARRLKRLGLTTAFLQVDEVNPTGTVKVDVDSDGQPKFKITEGVAWDFLDCTPEWKNLAARADAVCFGSLAQRTRQSRNAIASFLRAIRPHTVKVFDVNLRQSFYSAEILSASAKVADIIKLNQDELKKVSRLLGYEGRADDELAEAHWLIRVYGTKMVCVTRGAQGSLLATKSSSREHPGCAIEVADTVGAGDAFTAALLYHYLRGATIEIMSDAANLMGSWVASQKGATPGAEVKLLDKIRESEGVV